MNDYTNRVVNIPIPGGKVLSVPYGDNAKVNINDLLIGIQQDVETRFAVEFDCGDCCKKVLNAAVAESTEPDLTTFTPAEGECLVLSENQSKRRIIASSVIDINVYGKEDAIRIMNMLTASLKAKPSEYGQSSMQSQYIERENIVRVTLWGEIRFIAIMMDTLATLTEPNKEE